MLSSTKYVNAGSSFLKFFVIITIAGLALGSLLLPFLDQQAEQNTFLLLSKNANKLLEEDTRILTEYTDANIEHVNFLHSVPPVNGLARASFNNGMDELDNTTYQQWVSRLQTIYKAYLLTHSDIKQIRYIGIDGGKELVKVQRKNGLIAVTEGEELQDKSQEPYFKRALNAKPNQILASHITLNREHGTIEQPAWPTQRFFKPVFEQNQLFGFIIINIDITNFFDSFQLRETELTQFILNQRGGFLYHPDKTKAFGFEYDEEATWDNAFIKQPEAQINQQISEYKETQSGDVFFFMSKRVNYGRFNELTLVTGFSQEAIHHLSHSAKQMNAVIITSSIIFFILMSLIYQYGLSKKNSIIQTNARFKAIVDNSNNAIISLDEDGTVTGWNLAAESMFLYSTSYALGKSIFQLILEQKSPVFTKDIVKRVFKGEAIPTFSTKANNRKQVEIIISVTLSPIASEKDEIFGVTAIIRDITEEIRIERELIELNNTLEEKVTSRTHELEQARNEALQASNFKSEFIANVSHEIRTPMNGVLGMLTLLKREKLSEKQRHLADTAEKSANNLVLLINSILDLSKLESGKFELENIEFDLLALLSDVANSFSIPIFSKGLDFSFDVGGIHHQHVRGDPTRIRQVIINLIGNALKFTDAGKISLITLATDKGHKLELECKVIDTGVGIAIDKVDKLFESYSQENDSISRRYGGTGLGLSICKHIVELMGGHIHVESQKDQGSVFSFTMQLDKQDIPNKKYLDQTVKLTHSLIISSNIDFHQVLNGIIDDWKIPRENIKSSQEAGQSRAVQETLQGSSSQVDLMIIDEDNIPENIDVGQLAHQAPHALVLVFMNPVNTSKAYTGYINQPNIKRIPKPITHLGLAYHINKSQTETLSLHKPASPATDSASQAGNKTQAYHVLVVDDHEINLEVASGILEDIDCEVVTANSGIRALATLKDLQNVHIIFLDCQMPEMDGYQTARAIRNGEAGEANRSIPIIALTADVVVGTREQCLEAGMDDYLAKPVDPDELEKMVHKWALKPQPVPQPFPPEFHNEVNAQEYAADFNTNLDPSSSVMAMPANLGTQVETDTDELLVKVHGDKERLRLLSNLLFEAFDSNVEHMQFEYGNAINGERNAFNKLGILNNSYLGNIGNLGETQALRLCSEVQLACHHQDIAALKQCFPQFIQYLANLKARLESLLSHKPS
ncbi:Signal transduction histidine-protein kinase BarA [Thalassocella blandensis]|nr:Signal transduction histidine-protein kinase BarA [Thalassocella blandensis]